MTLSSLPSATSLDVRSRLVEALRLDLVGPWPGHELEHEMLYAFERPSTWYMTGFLVPRDSPAEVSSDADADDDLGVEAGAEGLKDEAPDDKAAAKKAYYPSSIGLSFLIPTKTQSLKVLLTWGDYRREDIPKNQASTGDEEDPPPEEEDAETLRVWARYPQVRELELSVTLESTSVPVPDSGGLELHVVARPVSTTALQGRIPEGTSSVSVFLVNARPHNSERVDEQYAFQPRIQVSSSAPFVPRPDLRGLQALGQEWDDLVADLHYADAYEFATGHGIAAGWDDVDGICHVVRSAWIPEAVVEKTMTASVADLELGMETLGALADEGAVQASLAGLVHHYGKWIASNLDAAGSLQGTHKEVAEEVLRRAGIAAERIERGIEILKSDESALDAFKVANRAVASALRKRLNLQEEPAWRPFQLAFLLLNLPGIADPTSAERDTVDLLFFPTGGGKTEAYLGLAAFAMVLRRLRAAAQGSPLSGAGVTVIMRYTLRLLTLDQLGRASGLMCALELEREKQPDRYGAWPFEIGLWVGKGATPNIMGRKGDGRDDTARRKVHAFKQDSSKPVPVPIEACPWCGTPFEPDCFNLLPNDDQPRNLIITCMNFECDFSGERHLPIVAVDDPIYRRLPAFLIATVDKFASLPWTGASGGLLGGASRYDTEGFYGPVEPNRGQLLQHQLPPPDLIIQDELHLISGPLGTMTGLYETAIDALCTREVNGKRVRPKIVASTATARRADDQVRALFARPTTELFPPPGIDRRDSFFAKVAPSTEVPGRLYLGIAAQGRSAKVVMRRTWLVLMAAAEKSFEDSGGADNEANPADPYMSVLGYFNSLRELGGARRILEEEVRHTVREYGRRRRVGESEGLFRDRRRPWDVVELTSRVSTSEVSMNKRKLEATSSEDRFVETAVATNMISVGLDIPRLGLMVVLGQPKSHAEYIQATSRVGRADDKPGLVVTLLNLAKPRDRSHYERFRNYHETFYRSVEVTSVTPFAARALDRGFAGAMVALARHIEPTLSPSAGANEIKPVRTELEELLRTTFVERVKGQRLEGEERDAIMHRVESRIADLLDAWIEIQEADGVNGVKLHYQKYETGANTTLLKEILEDTGDDTRNKFRANRSLRDVEPEVALGLSELPVGTWGRSE